MKRTALLGVFFVVLLVGALGFVNTSSLRIAKASTNVNSMIITSDTTWMKTNSPYNLTGNVLIENGVTVTVEAGAVLNLNGYYIRVNGTLIVQPGATINMGLKDASSDYTKLGEVGYIEVNNVMTARGTSAHPILFNGATYYWDSIGVPPAVSFITFADPSMAWNETTGSGCIIEYSVLDKTGTGGGSFRISNNRISSAGIGVRNGAPIIANNEVSSGGISVSGGSPTIANNNINGGYVSIDDNNGIDSPIIASNVISNSNPQWPYATSAAISVTGNIRNEHGQILIEKNILKNSGSGIILAENEKQDIRKIITIQYNTITNNAIGISITDRFSPTITNNNIYNNNASIKLSSFASRDVNATNNWWGTTDTAMIDRSIYDFNDDFNMGKVNYTPFLTEANPQATPNPNTPLPTPSTTPAPPENPPETPPQPDASNTEPEIELNPTIAIAAAAIVFIAVLLVVVGLVIGRRR